VQAKVLLRWWPHNFKIVLDIPQPDEFLDFGTFIVHIISDSVIGIVTISREPLGNEILRNKVVESVFACSAVYQS
jgi:hypothetical protein